MPVLNKLARRNPHDNKQTSTRTIAFEVLSLQYDLPSQFRAERFPELETKNHINCSSLRPAGLLPYAPPTLNSRSNIASTARAGHRITVPRCRRHGRCPNCYNGFPLWPAPSFSARTETVKSQHHGDLSPRSPPARTRIETGAMRASVDEQSLSPASTSAPSGVPNDDDPLDSLRGHGTAVAEDILVAPSAPPARRHAEEEVLPEESAPETERPTVKYATALQHRMPVDPTLPRVFTLEVRENVDAPAEARLKDNLRLAGFSGGESRSRRFEPSLKLC